MVLLMGFAFVAGIGTALSPCVLPVLPIALSAGATGGSRPPPRVVTGPPPSFTFAPPAPLYVIARLQQAMGAVMVVFGVLMLANLDTRFQNAIAADLPSFLVNPTGGLERSASVSKALAGVRGGAAPATHESSGLK